MLAFKFEFFFSYIAEEEIENIRLLLLELQKTEILLERDSILSYEDRELLRIQQEIYDKEILLKLRSISTDVKKADEALVKIKSFLDNFKKETNKRKIDEIMTMCVICVANSGKSWHVFYFYPDFVGCDLENQYELHLCPF